MHCALQDTDKKAYPAAVGGKSRHACAPSEDWGWLSIPSAALRASLMNRADERRVFQR